MSRRTREQSESVAPVHIGRARTLCDYELVVLGVVVAQCDLTKGHLRNALQANTYYVHGHRLMDVETGRRVNAPYICGHCGRPMGDIAGGSASVVHKGRMVRVCHPNVEDRPDCYKLIVTYNEVVGVRQTEARLGYRGSETA